MGAGMVGWGVGWRVWWWVGEWGGTLSIVIRRRR